jgi:SOS-response transcriptional repressor LexA
MDEKVMNIRESIAKRITSSRKAVGITIKELAARTQTLSPARISNWEQGTRSPGPVEAKILAEQLKVSASYLLCITDNPQGELTSHSDNGLRYIPVLSMKDAPHAKEIIGGENASAHEKTIVVDNFNKSMGSGCLFAVTVEDNSMEPQFKPGDVVIIDGELIPKPGDYVLAYLEAKQQVIMRKYCESDGYLFQLLANNELWATVSVKLKEDASIIGVISEIRIRL